MKHRLRLSLNKRLKLRLKQNQLGPLFDVGVIQEGTSIEIMKVITAD